MRFAAAAFALALAMGMAKAAEMGAPKDVVGVTNDSNKESSQSHRGLNAADYIVTADFTGKTNPIDICDTDAADLVPPGDEFVPYCRGTVKSGWTGHTRDAFSDEDKCCKGDSACSEVTGWLGKGACQGPWSCAYSKFPLNYKSCQGTSSCYDFNAKNLMGQVILSCHGNESCIQMGRGTVGNVVASCHGYKACRQVAFEEANVAGDMFNSCCWSGTEQNSADPKPCEGYCMSGNLCPTFLNYVHNDLCPAPEAVAGSPATSSGLALADYEGTVVVGQVEGELSSCTAEASAGKDEITCNFEWRDADGTVKTSVSGAKLYSDIIAGSCEDATIEGGGAFKTTEAINNESTNGVTSATLSGTVDVGEKTGTVIKTYCARADLKDDTEGVSVLAAMTQVEVTYIYDQTGNFSVDNIATSPFNAETATAEDTREANLNAFHSDVNGDTYGGDALNIGEVFHIAVESNDSDVTVDITELVLKKKDGSLFSPSITPITGSQTNFVTTKDCTKTSSFGKNKCVVSTLLVPSLLDQQAADDNGIKVTGTASITYGRRFLKETRSLQADTEEFELDVDLKTNDDLPQIATAENSGSIAGASLATFAAIAAGYAIIA